MPIFEPLYDVVMTGMKKMASTEAAIIPPMTTVPRT
jgi:hypothetical protein